MTALALAEAAEGLVGTPFRLHGRDPQTGLDCIGLLAVALGQIDRPLPLPNGYALRFSSLSRWLPDPDACGFVPAQPPFLPGDAVLLQPGAGQIHLAIAVSDCGWVHAHAGLRRVVRQAVRPDGAILHHWRLAPES